MKRVLVVDDSKGWVDFHSQNILELFPDADIDKAYSAREGYDWVYNMLSNPYDLIITDLHMEYDFEPKYAGEWLVEQIKLLSQYVRTKIVICSACYNIKQIAESYGVDYIPKRLASSDKTVYENII